MNIPKGKRDLYLPILLSFTVIVASYPFAILLKHPVDYATPEILWRNCVLSYASIWGEYYGVQRWLASHGVLLLTGALWLRYRKKLLWFPLACATFACSYPGGIASLLYGMYLVYGYQHIP